jgi:hypothetical protein
MLVTFVAILCNGEFLCLEEDVSNGAAVREN